MLAPMLASKGDTVPRGDAWAHEVKWDGIRALVDIRDGVVHVHTRSGRDIGASFPELQPLADLVGDALIDGEIVRLDDGIPRLGQVVDRVHLDPARARRVAAATPVTLLAFDLLRLDGRDLTREPWTARRELLEGLDLADVSWQTPPTYDDGEALLAAARAQGLEGIVSKKRRSTYTAGARSGDWLKFPIRPTGSFVVGGFKFQTDSDVRIGALAVGVPSPEGLIWRGRVGSGVAGAAERTLRGLLPGLVRADSPFVSVERADAVEVVWVEPVLVVDLAYLVLTNDGRLRQPSYVGLRPDLTPEDVHG